ncbi:unnamed protein product [Nippostrongylus brasiliensis]|uniref:Protein dispatched (inferred by orthology to a D. melanogaster protein) n=1 Tax=Nippostrongylus brasiliensis TaxID=27835 RepID=A0A0N4Y9L8_NIPBR|nr:unnamed protein product [Nippostrongylus brasiliensis]
MRLRGFETRGTPLANARFTLDAIKRGSAKSVDILGAKFQRIISKRQAKVFKAADSGNNAVNSATTRDPFSKTDAVVSSTMVSTHDPINVNYDEYGTESEPTVDDLSDPCVQYSALGSRIPYVYVDYTAKIIFEIKSKEVFSLDVFRRLCEVDRIIDRVVKTSSYKPPAVLFKHSLNLPLIEKLRSAVEECRNNSTHSMCSSPLIQQVAHYLLPKDPVTHNDLVAVILKDHFVGDVALKGAFFNVKNMEFHHSLLNDAKIAAVSALLVLTCFLLYSRSFLYTFIISVIIFLSMGIAFFFYTVILRIHFFPPINLLALVLMIAVGADDAFLLLVYFSKYKKTGEEPYRPGDPYIPLYKERDRLVRAIRCSLRHSLASMFVTSATTAIAFISNLTSDIIVLSKHPYEWYDNNEHLFDFKWKRRWHFMENYVIGVDPLEYFIAVPTNITISLDAKEVESVVRNIERNCEKLKSILPDVAVMCLTSSDMTRYYDIITTLSSSTLFSVAISVVVSLTVVVACTRRLLLSLLCVAVICAIILWTTAALILSGWELSVVESTIIVLTIGLSFDFTLHLAMALRDDNEKDIKAKISSCLSVAGKACLLGALTSVLCGIPLLFANTAAFAQVGSMLVTLGVASLFGATLVFPAVVIVITGIRSTSETVRF